MQIPVLIEPIAGNGYRARGGEPFALTGEGPTREDALAKLKELLQARLRDGAEVVGLELTPTTHPLAEFVGMFRKDPMIEDWKEAMAEYRRKIDEKPDLP
jgi:predicted RNase H-like HicB family nuclease